MTVIPFLLALALSCGQLTLATPLSTSPNPYRQPSTLTLAPVFDPGHYHAHKVINDSYIIVLKKGVSPAVLATHVNFVQNDHAKRSLVDDLSSGLRHVYDSHIKGYAGKFAPETVEMIRAQPEVDYIERDQIVHTMEHKVQKGAPWGLARLSHREKLHFSTFSRYEYEEKGGEGVDVYVIDTGINTKHLEFEGRAKWGKTIPADASDFDGNGHGTHCAGTIGSRLYGVAKSAHIYAVKVLGDNGSGSMSDVVGGVVWASESASAKLAAARAELAKTGKTNHKGSVANMSLGGGRSRALDEAVNAAVDAGMHFAVAAGNDNRDACDYSPAAAEKALTLGASSQQDERAYFSNHGKCVDIFGPGVNILSTWTGSEDAKNSISGTSMASPHAAGLLAYYLSLYPSAKFAPFLEDEMPASVFATVENVSTLSSFAQSTLPSWLVSWLTPRVFAPRAEVAPIPIITPAQLKKVVIGLATKGVLTDLPANTVNLLIFNNATTKG